MHKNRRRISFLWTVAAVLAAFPSGAFAQYHTYTTGKPQVEVDLSALGEIESQREVDYSTYPTAPDVAPVLQMPLTETQAEMQNAPRMPAAPQRRILKPPPVPASSPVAQPVPQQEFPAPIVARPDAPVAPPPPAHKPERKIISSMGDAPSVGVDETETDMVAPLVDEEGEGFVSPLPEQPSTQEDGGIDWASPAPATETPVVPALTDLTLSFNGNESELSPDLMQKLDAVALQLREMGDSRLQVRAFATGEDGTKGSARRIALSRALSVRSYLMDKGIKPVRVDVRAMGSETDRAPLDRVDLVFVR